MNKEQKLELKRATEEVERMKDLEYAQTIVKLLQDNEGNPLYANVKEARQAARWRLSDAKEAAS